MTWKQVFTVGTVMVGGFLYLIYKSQEKILYLNEQIPPKKTGENPYPFANPLQQHMKYEDVWLTTPDNIRLHAWFIPAPSKQSPLYSSYLNNIHTNNNNNNNNNKEDSAGNSDNNRLDDTYNSKKKSSKPIIVWFHANAGNMGFRLPNLQRMHSELGCDLFILSYRGYGESDGEPSETGLKTDSETALDFLLGRSPDNTNNLDMDPSRIFVFGRSLGGAVAVHAAAKYDSALCGIILENTFTSISDMVGKVFPFLNFDIIKQFMLKIHWKSVELIGNIKSPMLFLASEKDEIVPHDHMNKLFDTAGSEYKKMHKIPEGMHNDAWVDEKGGPQYWNVMREFIGDAIRIKEAKEAADKAAGGSEQSDSPNGLKSEL